MKNTTHPPLPTGNSQLNTHYDLLTNWHQRFRLYPRLGALLGGADQAIIFQQLHYGMQRNHGNPEYIRQGLTWVPRSIEKWHVSLEALTSISTMRRSFAHFRKLGIVLEDTFSTGSINRTSWRTIDYEHLNRIYTEKYFPARTAAEGLVSPFHYTEKYVLINPSLVSVVGGIPQAAFLQEVHHWTNHNAPRDKANNYHDGKVWMRRSQGEWIETVFPWLKRKETIKAYTAQLRKAGLIHQAKYGRSDWDHTAWYSINYTRLHALIAEQNT